MVKQIRLANGQFSLVDDEDFEKISRFKWKQRHGYAIRSTFSKGKHSCIFMHRLIMGDGPIIDHINQNKLDNRRINLRFADKSKNGQNRGKQRGERKYTSIYKGVNKVNNRWRSLIRCEGQTYHLGYFDTAEEAAQAYNKKARELFGDFACENMINPF